MLIRTKQIDGLEKRPQQLVNDIAKDIEAQGLLVPIDVIALPGKRYLLINGHTRVHAYRKLGKAEIAARILTNDAIRRLIDSDSPLGREVAESVGQ